DGPNGGSYRNPRWNSEGSDEDASDYDTTDGGGGEVRETRPDRETQGGGGQDRERHQGNREHHQQSGGRDRGRHAGNGAEPPREANGNGADPADTHQSDDTAPDP